MKARDPGNLPGLVAIVLMMTMLALIAIHPGHRGGVDSGARDPATIPETGRPRLHESHESHESHEADDDGRGFPSVGRLLSH